MNIWTNFRVRRKRAFEEFPWLRRFIFLCQILLVIMGILFNSMNGVIIGVIDSLILEIALPEMAYRTQRYLEAKWLAEEIKLEKELKDSTSRFR